ncbi:preprotein translocase subunit YajC [Clostridium putrefaciens]|nr:preprotein translocase subunit YajC [Clostridium putrefaciens]
MSQILRNILPIVVMLGLFYAIVFIPENKRRKKYSSMLQDLKANDEVLTRGGIMGKVINIQDDFVIIESGPERSRLKISKQGIASVVEEKDKIIE